MPTPTNKPQSVETFDKKDVMHSKSNVESFKRAPNESQKRMYAGRFFKGLLDNGAIVGIKNEKFTIAIPENRIKKGQESAMGLSKHATKQYFHYEYQGLIEKFYETKGPKEKTHAILKAALLDALSLHATKVSKTQRSQQLVRQLGANLSKDQQITPDHLIKQYSQTGSPASQLKALNPSLYHVMQHYVKNPSNSKDLQKLSKVLSNSSREHSSVKVRQQAALSETKKDLPWYKEAFNIFPKFLRRAQNVKTGKDVLNLFVPDVRFAFGYLIAAIVSPFNKTAAAGILAFVGAGLANPHDTNPLLDLGGRAAKAGASALEGLVGKETRALVTKMVPKEQRAALLAFVEKNDPKLQADMDVASLTLNKDFTTLSIPNKKGAYIRKTASKYDIDFVRNASDKNLFFNTNELKAVHGLKNMSSGRMNLILKSLFAEFQQDMGEARMNKVLFAHKDLVKKFSGITLTKKTDLKKFDPALRSFIFNKIRFSPEMNKKLSSFKSSPKYKALKPDDKKIIDGYLAQAQALTTRKPQSILTLIAAASTHSEDARNIDRVFELVE